MSRPLNSAQRHIASQSRLLATLPSDLRETLLDSARADDYVRGETIFHIGDTAQHLHIVAHGWVKLYRIAPNGSEAVVHTLTRGESFGEPIALRRADYPVSAEASSDCQLIIVPADALLSMLQTRPEIAISVIASILVHLQGLVGHIEQLKTHSVTQRVAAFLLDLCEDDAESATVMLPYDKALIAGRLGMQPESLSRAFARLRRYGVMVNQNSADIVSIDRLREMVADEGC